MAHRLKPFSSFLSLLVCVGAIACGDDATDPPAATGGAGGASGASGASPSGGAAGASGTSGAAGAAGAGAGGKSGNGGAAGAGASSGAAGAAGAAGSAGASGAAGSSGSAGEAGASGNAGDAGSSGSGGEAGSSGSAGEGGAGGMAGAGAGGGAAGSEGGTAGAAGEAGGGQAGNEQGGSGQGGQSGSDPGGAAGDTSAGAAGDAGTGGAIVVGDYTVAVSPTSVTIVQGQTVGFEVTLDKTNGFDGDITLSFEGLPSGLTAPATPITIPAGQTSAHVDLTASAAATVTTSEVTVHAKAPGGFDRTTTFSAIVQAAPDFVLSIDPPALTIAQGADASVTLTVAKVGGFDGDVTLTFEGLPDGVHLPAGALTIPAGSTQLSVTLTADATADLGTQAITVKATSGSLVHQTTFNATVQVAAAIISDACPVNGLDVCLPYVDFRQGYNGVRVKFTATNVVLPGTTVTLGNIPGVLLAKGGDEYIATFDIPHGEALGTKNLTLTNPTGPGTKAAVIQVTPITVASTAVAPGVAGNDATGRGTPLAPFRTIKKANEVAATGDAISVLTYSATATELFPIVIKTGTTLKGVPSATNVPPAIAASSGVTCAIELTGAAEIGTLQVSACEITKKGAGLLTLTDVRSYTAGARGVTVDEGEVNFGCSGNLTATYCRIESKTTAISVATGAKVSGAPQIVGGSGTSDVGIDVAGAVDLKGASFSSTVELALAVTGTASVIDSSVSAGPSLAADMNAALVVSGNGQLTATGLAFAAVRRRGLLLKDNASADIGSGTWTGAGTNTEASRYFVRLEGASTLKAANITATSTSSGTDIFELAGTGAMSLSDSNIRGADTSPGSRGLVGFASATSAVTITRTTLSLFRAGSVLALAGFGGTFAVGTGTQFETLNGSATGNPGALVDNRAEAGTAITVANGVTFGGLVLGQGGDKTKDSPKLLFGNPAIPIWSITGDGVITFL